MKKTVRRIGSTCGLLALLFGSSSAHAFCTEFDIFDIGVNCVGEGHKRITEYIKPILRDNIWGAVWNGNYAQDNPLGDFRNDGQRHFESCRFVPENDEPGSIDYIQKTYRSAISRLNPADPDPFDAAEFFGKLLHTVQDFYSHTNWINLVNLTAPDRDPVIPADLFDSSLGEWRLIDWLGTVRGNIIIGQIPPDGLPAGWSVDQALDSETPIFMTNDGSVRRGLITGWNSSGACPDVREGTIVDDYSHVEMDPITGIFTPVPRTLRLVHGTSEVAGIYGGPFGIAYQRDRPCRDDYPTSICIQKDTPGRTDYDQALQLAEYQTAHEWCRLLHLAKDSQYGYAASSILMALWSNREDEPFGPHPISTACGTPLEVLTGKPGPIEVTVNPQEVAVQPGPDVPLHKRHLVFALYTGDLRRSIYRTFSTEQSASSVETGPMTMCVKPTDTLVATVWGWDDRLDLLQPIPDLDFNAHDQVLRGTTLVLNGPGFQAAQGAPDNQDLVVDFQVTVEGTDLDGDGLSACGEQFYGTNPNDADTDDDGLPDGIEVDYGTDPLDDDSDGDGLPDGQDVEWIEDVIAGIPDAALKSAAAGLRTSMLNLLNDAEALLLEGDRRGALNLLSTLRKRIDGCGVVSDGNDWIVDCAIQTEIRKLVDLLIANVSA